MAFRVSPNPYSNVAVTFRLRQALRDQSPKGCSCLDHLVKLGVTFVGL